MKGTPPPEFFSSFGQRPHLWVSTASASGFIVVASREVRSKCGPSATMGILDFVEDRPTPKAVYNWRVYTAAAVASWASCMIGYDSAFIGTTLALPSFVSEFKLNEMDPDHLALTKANIVSVYQAGAFFGSFGAYVSSYYLGRRKSLLIWAMVFILGAGMMLGANRERGLGLIIGGRVLAGLGIGASSNIVPIYISELSPPAVRGRLVGIYELGWQVGGLVGFWINYGLQETMAPSHTQWIIPFAVQLIPAGCLLIGALWMKESPRWLFTKGKREQAMANLCWVRNLPADDLYIIEEVAAIDSQIEHDRIHVGPGFWKPFAALKQRKVLWRFFLGGMLFLWQNGSGINAINYYSPTVFHSIGITGTSTGFLTTGIFGVVKTVVTVIWLLWLIDRLGRTKLLMIGAFGGSMCMWFIGAYIKIAGANASNPNAKLSSGGIAAIFFFYLWTAFYTPSWNGTPWVINSEMFSQNTRSLGQASAAANNWFWNFIVSRFTPQMFLTMGYGVYFFFASLMLLSIPFVYFLIPETKSIPLERMDDLFEIKPVRAAHAEMMERLKLEEVEFRHNAEGAHVSIEKMKNEDERNESV
ncbi:general substrate transporter [Lentithecium fluviatile CBS 122367]|uniref:Quinate transporter n=1 Tax=Lentithecium fluviatile CBS 122367 TaxID=1168545 RepID=A0A6G1JAL6_9PLEO|nr:general substrate transporter [Lentithecium fluviatile CBS 122367]